MPDSDTSAPAAAETFPVAVDLPVQWGDMDAFGHVNNVVFLRWFESARVAWFARAGGWGLAPGGSSGPVLVHQDIDYRRAVAFPDTVRAAVRMSALGRTSFEFRCRMTNRAGETVAEARAVGVLLDFGSGRPVPIPDALRERARTLQGDGSA